MTTEKPRHPRRPARAGRTVLLATLAGVLAVLLGAAGSAPGAAPAEAGAAPAAYLRTAHLVAGAGPVDIRLTPFSAEGDLSSRPEDGALARTTSYGAVDAYAAVAPGSYAVTVRPGDSAADADPMLQSTVTLSPGHAYTVVAVGAEGDEQLQLLEDDLTPPPAGQSEVRLFSAVPQARVALDGQVAEQVPPGTGYVPVPAGDRLMEVSDGTSSTSLRVGLASRSSYTVFVRRGPQGALGVQAVLDQAATEQVPVGGVATGLGGMADGGSPAGPPLPALALSGALVLAVLALVALRLRAGRPLR